MELKDSATAAIGFSIFVLFMGVITGGFVFYIAFALSVLFIGYDYYRLYSARNDLRRFLNIKRGLSRAEIFIGSTTQLVYRLSYNGRSARTIKLTQELDAALTGNTKWKPAKLYAGSSAYFTTILEASQSNKFTIVPPEVLFESWIFKDKLGVGKDLSLSVFLPVGTSVQRLGYVGLRSNKEESIFDATITKRGGGMNFLSIRRYIGGDSLKRIDWVRSTRMNDLMVREFEDEQPMPAFFLIDLDPSMGLDEPVSGLATAKELAAAVINKILVNGERIGIACFSGVEVVRQLYPGSGQDHLYNMRMMLSGLEPVKENGRQARHDQEMLPYDLKNAFEKGADVEGFIDDALKGYMANIKDDGFSRAMRLALRSLNTQSRIVVITNLSMGMTSLLNNARIAKYYGHKVSIVLLPHTWHEDEDLVDIEAKGSFAVLNAHGIDVTVMYPGTRAEDVIRTGRAVSLRTATGR